MSSKFYPKTKATQGQVIDFVEKAFGTGQISNQGLNISVICPICARSVDNLTKKKLVIRTDDWLTHCWRCGYKSTNLIHLIKTFKLQYLAEYKERFSIQGKENYEKCSPDLEKILNEVSKDKIKPELPPIVLPIGFQLLAPIIEQTKYHSLPRQIKSAWDYLSKRGLLVQDLWRWKLGITEHVPTSKEDPNYRYRIIVPSFDSKGKPNYFTGRLYWEKYSSQKYKNPSYPREEVVFDELNLDWESTIVLVEGVFDMFKSVENTTAVLGSTLDTSYVLFQHLVEKNTPTILAFDPDALTKTLTIAKLLSSYGNEVRIATIPAKYKDIGEMPKQEVKICIKEAKLFDELNFLRNRIQQKK